MYVAIYRWKLKPGSEDAFTKHWEAGTWLFRFEQKTLGSRLHRADDGTYFAYAQWPSRESYHAKRALSGTHKENLAKMKECVEEAFPVILGDVSCDRLVQPREACHELPSNQAKQW